MRFYVITLPSLWVILGSVSVTAQSTSVELYWNMQSEAYTHLTNVNLQSGNLLPGNNYGNTVFLSNQVSSAGYTGASGENNGALAARTGPLQKEAQGSAYVEFTLTPLTGYRLFITSFSFGIRSTLTGPRQWNLCQSEDQYVVAMAAGNIENNSTWSLVTINGLTWSTAKAITIRLYGFGGQGVSAINVANWRIDDLLVTGTMAPDNLPVTLIAQKAFSLPKEVFIQWSTEKEINCEGYLIKRSTDGQIFNTVGYVHSATLSGTTNGLANYSFTDHNPGSTLTFYSIVQRDRDSNIHAFPILVVDRRRVLTTSFFKLIKYNEGAGSIQLKFIRSEKLLFEIVDIKGNTCKAVSSIAGVTDHTMSVGHLIPGVYVVVVRETGSGKLVASELFQVSH